MMRRLPALAWPAASRLVAAVALLAFLLQGLAVQTHIHGGPARIQALAQVTNPAHPDPNDPLDPANCSLCQEMVHAGAALAPVIPSLPLLLAWVALAPVAISLPAARQVPRLGWQGRAPPRR